MPLDASIILSGAPQRTEPLNLLSNYAQLQQIQQNRIALSAHQQALQMGQLSQKAAELHLADQQLSSQQNQEMLGILRENQGNVPASIQQGMARGLPQAQELLKHQGAAEELLAKTQKEQAEAAKATYEVKAKQRNSAINSLSTLRGLAPELQPLYYQHLRMQALQADPNLGNQLPPTWNPQAEQMVGALQESLLSQKEREDQALKQQEFGLKQQEFGLKEQTAQGQQQRWEAQTEQGKRQTELRAQEIGQQGAYQRGRLGLAQREFQQQFGDPLARLSAEQLAEAKKYASGDLKLPPAGSRAPNAQAMREAAIKINPNLSEDTFTVKHDFNDPSKTGGKNLATMARIAGHIGRFEKNSGAMSTLESAAYGMGTTLTGTQKATAEDAHAIAAELEKLTSGGVGSQSQTQGWQHALRSSSASVRQQAVNEISQIIGSQFEGMNAQYKAQTQEDLPLGKYVSPVGREWLRKNNINVSGAVESTGAPANVQSLRQKYKY
jgi:hypothetical protein